MWINICLPNVSNHYVGSLPSLDVNSTLCIPNNCVRATWGVGHAIIFFFSVLECYLLGLSWLLFSVIGENNGCNVQCVVSTALALALHSTRIYWQCSLFM